MLQHKTTSSKANERGKIVFPSMLLILILGLMMIILPASEIKAQQKEKADTSLHKAHSPTRAAIFSAVLPGLGQGYNKKYWKIPIVYAGFGLITYFIVSNTGEFKKYKEAYTYVANGDSTYIDNDYVDKYDQQQLLDGKNYHQRNMELSYIVGGLWYLLNIIDASVDAHFFDYDVSEDLSIRIDPMMHIRKDDFQPLTGIKLTVNF
jgi:hypothetical protein